MVLNNIKVDNSVVGSINTGNVQAIDVSLTNLHNTGNDQARDALKALTEAILSDTSTGDTQKNELVEQVAFLSEQAVVNATDRNRGLIRATFSALTQAAGTVTAMAGAWQAAEPILKSLFSL
jgi:tRNA A-37 threonylcarbamoyl transferase component Bud32